MVIIGEALNGVTLVASLFKVSVTTCTGDEEVATCNGGGGVLCVGGSETGRLSLCGLFEESAMWASTEARAGPSSNRSKKSGDASGSAVCGFIIAQKQETKMCV